MYIMTSKNRLHLHCRNMEALACLTQIITLAIMSCGGQIFLLSAVRHISVTAWKVQEISSETYSVLTLGFLSIFSLVLGNVL